MRSIKRLAIPLESRIESLKYLSVVKGMVGAMENIRTKISEWRVCCLNGNFSMSLLLLMLLFSILCIGQEEAIEQPELTVQPPGETAYIDSCLISLGTKEGNSFSLEALDASGISYEYVVPESYDRGEDKEPTGRTIQALVYDYDKDTCVYLGYHQPWFYMKSDSKLTPKTICDELRRLVGLGVFLGLTEEDLNEIEETLSKVQQWEFGIEVGCTEKGWQQVFPKSEVNPAKGTKRMKK
jgi:hypothetical protein